MLVQVFATLPIPVLLLLTGLETISPSVLESVRLEGGGRSILRRMILPQLGPYLLASAGVLLILSLSDYSVPSVFQYNVYALDLFAEFSFDARHRSGQPDDPARAAGHAAGAGASVP